MSVQSDEEWDTFYCDRILGCWLANYRTCDNTGWTQNDVNSVEILSLQGWCVARTTHRDSGHDFTIGTYWLPDLYLP